jgi:hypothetical protein
LADNERSLSGHPGWYVNGYSKRPRRNQALSKNGCSAAGADHEKRWPTGRLALFFTLEKTPARFATSTTDDQITIVYRTGTSRLFIPAREPLTISLRLIACRPQEIASLPYERAGSLRRRGGPATGVPAGTDDVGRLGLAFTKGAAIIAVLRRRAFATRVGAFFGRFHGTEDSFLSSITGYAPAPDTQPGATGTSRLKRLRRRNGVGRIRMNFQGGTQSTSRLLIIRQRFLFPFALQIDGQPSISRNRQFAERTCHLASCSCQFNKTVQRHCTVVLQAFEMDFLSGHHVVRQKARR